jgi:hypothetical protein
MNIVVGTKLRTRTGETLEVEEMDADKNTVVCRVWGLDGKELESKLVGPLTNFAPFVQENGCELLQ